MASNSVGRNADILSASVSISFRMAHDELQSVHCKQVGRFDDE